MLWIARLFSVYQQSDYKYFEPSIIFCSTTFVRNITGEWNMITQIQSIIEVSMPDRWTVSHFYFYSDFILYKHTQKPWQLRSWLITRFVTTCRLTRRVSLVEQELLTLPEHLSSPPVFSRDHVTRSLVLYVCFVDHCLSFCTFSVGHCVVYSSSIYRFWLPLWYL